MSEKNDGKKDMMLAAATAMLFIAIIAAAAEYVYYSHELADNRAYVKLQEGRYQSLLGDYEKTIEHLNTLKAVLPGYPHYLTFQKNSTYNLPQTACFYGYRTNDKNITTSLCVNAIRNDFPLGLNLLSTENETLAK